MAPNDAKIAKQLEELKRLRSAPDKSLPIGFGPGQIAPTTANALQKAGLARLDASDGTRRVVAVD